MRETEGFIYKVFKWYSEFNGQEEPPPAPIWRYYLCSTSSSTSGQREFMDNDTMDSTRDHDIWNERFEDRLVDMLYEDTLMDRLRGGRITNGDNVRLATLLSVVCHKKFNCEQVKRKIARLKHKQREFIDLMKQTGLGWDPKRKAPIAS